MKNAREKISHERFFIDMPSGLTWIVRIGVCDVA